MVVLVERTNEIKTVNDDMSTGFLTLITFNREFSNAKYKECCNSANIITLAFNEPNAIIYVMKYPIKSGNTYGDGDGYHDKIGTPSDSTDFIME